MCTSGGATGSGSASWSMAELGASHNTAPFAYRLARRVMGIEKASYRHEGSRNDLMTRLEFRKPFATPRNVSGGWMFAGSKRRTLFGRLSWRSMCRWCLELRRTSSGIIPVGSLHELGSRGSDLRPPYLRTTRRSGDMERMSSFDGDAPAGFRSRDFSFPPSRSQVPESSHKIRGAIPTSTSVLSGLSSKPVLPRDRGKEKESSNRPSRCRYLPRGNGASVAGDPPRHRLT